MHEKDINNAIQRHTVKQGQLNYFIQVPVASVIQMLTIHFLFQVTTCWTTGRRNGGVAFSSTF